MPATLVYLGLALAFAAAIWVVLRITGKQRRRRRDAARAHRIDLFTRTADQ